MKKIVIIGNSAAGISAAEAIRQKDKESRVTILSAEPYMAYQRHRLVDFLEGKIKERDLYFRSQDFYKNNDIDLLLEREVVELNVNKKKAIFKDRESVEFDELVIASGSRVLLPSIKGVQKEGVVSLSGLKDARFFVENLPLAHTVLVMGTCPCASRIAALIAGRSIEVKYFGVLKEPIPGVDTIFDNPIMEILGDSEVKAVRLATGKVIGASVVVFPCPRVPNVGFLRDSGLEIEKGILVDQYFRTNFSFIYAAGDVCELRNGEKTYTWEEARQEGQRVGGSLCQT